MLISAIRMDNRALQYVKYSLFSIPNRKQYHIRFYVWYWFVLEREQRKNAVNKIIKIKKKTEEEKKETK